MSRKLAYLFSYEEADFKHMPKWRTGSAFFSSQCSISCFFMQLLWWRKRKAVFWCFEGKLSHAWRLIWRYGSLKVTSCLVIVKRRSHHSWCFPVGSIFLNAILAQQLHLRIFDLQNNKKITTVSLGFCPDVLTTVTSWYRGLTHFRPPLTA